jgi:hypothetical protein
MAVSLVNIPQTGQYFSPNVSTDIGDLGKIMIKLFY